MRSGVQWFTALVQAGLETRFLTEKDLLAHATPSVLIASLPRDVLAGVFDSALGSGKMTPESILASVTTETLVEHAPASTTWACLAGAAERKGLASAGATSVADAAGVTEMLRRGLTAGLSLGVLTPADVVREVTPKILLAQFPDTVSVKLFEASLTAGVMNPALVVDTVGIEALAKHAPVQVWAVLAVAGYAISTGAREIHATPGRKPPAEVIDDIASVLVDLDETVKPEPKPADVKPAEVKPAEAKPVDAKGPAAIIPDPKPMPKVKDREAAKS
jgi:hypothetical protein